MGFEDDLGFFKCCVIMKNCWKILGKKFRNFLPQDKKFIPLSAEIFSSGSLKKGYPL